MASLSLPRVLHPRKTSLEIEREVFEKSQAQALQKAINSNETPVKQKHVRSAIIGTFHTQSAKIFWSYALRLPAMDDRIVAWKLCHVVHKVLREGHPLCLVDSQRHRNDLDEIGKLWGHLKEGYGKMIRLYTSLLIYKLEFHMRNPRFPGNLGVTAEELESIAGNDINNYFEMTVEMFDYLDHILELQEAVFGSLNMARSNSMTSAGQCRLAPLIPCILDASKLYDYCVKIMFKLHMTLPPDTLSGHRERFLKQFRLLKKFYESTSNLQYFKELIAIPPLPEVMDLEEDLIKCISMKEYENSHVVELNNGSASNFNDDSISGSASSTNNTNTNNTKQSEDENNPPNFLIMGDFRTYVTQEVIVPQEPEHEEEPLVEGNLIDTTEDTTEIDNAQARNEAMILAAQEELIKEREFLRGQCEKMRHELNAIMAKNGRDISKLQDKIVHLETELATKDSELVQERQVKEDLLNHSFAVAQSQDSEQKVKNEKFDKLKELYVKLRDEHIQKIREKAEVEKKLIGALKNLELLTELESTNEKLQEDQKQKSSELSALQKDKELFNMETEILKKSVMDACREKDGIKNELALVIQEKEELKKNSEELSYKLLDLERQLSKEQSDLQRKIKEIVTKSLESSEDILRHAIDEIDNPALTALTCSSDYLRSLTDGCKSSLEESTKITSNDYVSIVTVANRIAHRHATYILQGRATCNTSPDISFGEKVTQACKDLGKIVLKLLTSLKQNEDSEPTANEAKQKLEELAALADSIGASLLGEKAETLVDMLEDEMSAMDKAIEEAANRIQDMLTTSRAADSGIKLEVNEKILDSCTKLMQAIRILVQKSKLLQGEIVAQGRGTASAKEFYKRNHQWTDGFISAAKAVAVAAKLLLTAADKVVQSNGKLEQLVVAAQEIAASTAQLVVASRVKADRNSNNLQQLTQASKGVTTATGTVVATVKDCSELIDESEEYDFSNLTLHQAKRLEMDSQVRVLELEKELEQERYRLSRLRKHHYQLAGENET
ncbi:huntingtin-interacting protein 1 isoform X1 [Diabrotica virgifera virgifera]|uniref:Huntingtin-interacting protein 1 n=3 Tax=Diabrotica virgifera virgifera TaxID=50390 RepID=A0ABM5KYJ1_DIAVI|nr:huntingtin-interacting protein 1 isoform X1 [Diabrotica virgifera virgifera]